VSEPDLPQNLEARFENAVALVNEYGLRKEISNRKLKKGIKRVLKAKTNITNVTLCRKACESVFKEIVISPDMASDLLIASDNYAQDNQISINKATVRLVREIVYAVAREI
jgi:hypothetical protein